ncbi:MAG TPA: hypothetical protein VK324_10510 [Tepidisphaeraceae bacterium]|nr:hypothetical protein [Tepidisphaeraceae bacterium]
MTRDNNQSTALNALLSDPKIDRTQQQGRMLYNAIDVVEALSGSAHPGELWADLKVREPALARIADVLETTDTDGTARTAEFVDLAGVFRIVQAVPPSPKAERVKTWLAKTAAERLAEADNPELAIARVRKLHERKGHDRRWVSKRLGTVATRHDLAGEWARRGATDSDHYRWLTNELTKAGFGLDVEGYGRYKSLNGSNRSLRDHMTDLELSLMNLAEVTAAALSKDRDSHGLEELTRDVVNAGQVAAAAREQIEVHRGKPVVEPA